MKTALKAILLTLFALVLARGNLAFEATRQALQFWFNQLVPSLFVTMVLVSLCLDYQVFSHLRLLKPLEFLFQLNDAGVTLFLSCLLLGAPSGAVLVNQMVKEKRLAKEQGERLISCVSLATPSFIIVTCGAVFLHQLSLGVALWAIQAACCALFLMVWRTPPVTLTLPPSAPKFFPALKNAVKNSGTALFYIGGYLMMFLTVLNVLTAGLPSTAHSALTAIGEFSLGCSMASGLSIPLPLRFSLMAAILGFNGLCVHLQVVSLTDSIPLNYRHFLFLRVIQALIGFATGSILFSLLQ